MPVGSRSSPGVWEVPAGPKDPAYGASCAIILQMHRSDLENKKSYRYSTHGRRRQVRFFSVLRGVGTTVTGRPQRSVQSEIRIYSLFDGERIRG
jgi:hypothetical protein